MHACRKDTGSAHAEQRNAWPPKAALRHCSMADMTFNWPRLKCPRSASRHAGPWARKISATSRCATSAGLRRLSRFQRTDHLLQRVDGHLGIERGGVQLRVSEQDLDFANIHPLF